VCRCSNAAVCPFLPRILAGLAAAVPGDCPEYLLRKVTSSATGRLSQAQAEKEKLTAFQALLLRDHPEIKVHCGKEKDEKQREKQKKKKKKKKKGRKEKVRKKEGRKKRKEKKKQGVRLQLSQSTAGWWMLHFQRRTTLFDTT